MKMMDFAKLEEAAQDNWEKQTFGMPKTDDRIPFHLFRTGFCAGAAWAVRQAKAEGSSQAVGNMSPEVVRVLISQFVVWAQMKDLWLCRLLPGACPDALLYHEVPPLWKEFAAELCGDGVVSQYPAAVEEPEEEV